MATTADFIEFVCSQAEGTGVVRSKKMFGEYMVYINDKPVLLICNNTVYVKILPCLDGLMDGAGKGTPYEGAKKEHYILDIDDRELVHRVIAALEPVIPFPKPRKKKNKE